MVGGGGGKDHRVLLHFSVGKSGTAEEMIYLERH